MARVIFAAGVVVGAALISVGLGMAKRDREERDRLQREIDAVGNELRELR